MIKVFLLALLFATVTACNWKPKVEKKEALTEVLTDSDPHLSSGEVDSMRFEDAKDLKGLGKFIIGETTRKEAIKIIRDDFKDKNSLNYPIRTLLFIHEKKKDTTLTADYFGDPKNY